jgi:hypothetical protein
LAAAETLRARSFLIDGEAGHATAHGREHPDSSTEQARTTALAMLLLKKAGRIVVPAV